MKGIILFVLIVYYFKIFSSATHLIVKKIRYHPVLLNKFDDNERFPDNFQFGVSSSAFQIEGAWNLSGKSESIWDKLVHGHPTWIADLSNADISCDSYHKLQDDLDKLQLLQVNFYRFSIAWTRILPTGYANKINPDGVQYYNELIDGLLERNITPIVTIFHWDLPQALHEIGGWPNIIVADYYEDYARVLFRLFGDRVKRWVTFNEPNAICIWGYKQNVTAPGYTSDQADYLCGRTLLISHAKVYRLYQKEFNKDKQGKIGIVVHAHWYEPYQNTPEDKKAVDRMLRIFVGRWINPILSKNGDYPKIMKKIIATNDKRENFTRSRLVPFTKEEIQLIKGTADFLGINHYATLLVSSNMSSSEENIFSVEKDAHVKMYLYLSDSNATTYWVKPYGFRKVLNWIKIEYGNPNVYIMENGFFDDGNIDDFQRINFIQNYLKELLKAIKTDGCFVTNYAIWSFFDSFEWRSGYKLKFGIIHVDMNSPNRTRTLKKSAYYYKNVIKTKIP